MSKFQIGDRVVVSKASEVEYLRGCAGEVRDIYENAAYPYIVKFDDFGSRGFAADELLKLAEPEPSYVQVYVFDGCGPPQPWTYIDPSDTLLIGDRVLVPVGLADILHTGRVVAFGLGDCPASVRIKTVKAYLNEVTL